MCEASSKSRSIDLGRDTAREEQKSSVNERLTDHLNKPRETPEFEKAQTSNRIKKSKTSVRLIRKRL